MLATQICEDGDGLVTGAGGSVSSGCVSGPRRLRRGASAERTTSGWLQGWPRPWCGRIAALFFLGLRSKPHWRQRKPSVLLVIVFLGCVSCVLVVGMIPLDRLFVPLGRFLRRFGGCKVGYTVSHWVSVVQPVMYHPSQGMVAKWDHLSTCQRMSAFKLPILTDLGDVGGTADSAY
jgi:hypothetical protein